MRKIHIITFLAIFGISRLSAHNPNEVSYYFNLDSKELTIYLTPKSAVDLLKKVNPELGAHTTFNFSDYTQNFETYFNEKISLVLSGMSVGFRLTYMDLAQHNAAFRFEMENLPKDVAAYEIIVDSFLNIYQKGKNYVFISADEKKHRYIFDHDKKQASGTFKTIPPQNSDQGKALLYLSLIFVILSVGFAVYRKTKFTLNHPTKPKS